MSRHRNIRAIDVDEEYDGYYSCYGHSVEDDICISPQTEAEFIYKRPENQSAALSLNDSVSEEQMMDDDLQHSIYKLNAFDNAKLQSCVEAMQDVVGETISETLLQRAAYDHGFDLEKALNSILSEKAPKHQRKDPENPRADDKMDICLKDTCSESTESDTCTDSGQKKTRVDINEKTKFPSNQTSNQNLKLIPSCQAEANKVPLYKSQKVLYSAEEIYKKVRGNEKIRINLVVVGHVDAGKSTLMGHTLYKLGQVSKKSMHKYEQDSKKLGKASFMYAWVLDETPEERNRGITMDIAQMNFETQSKCVIILDAPGHQDFIPNMIKGATQADAAILVVDSTKGEFETGLDDGGQTKEHLLLIRSLGISELVVAVNKMDNVAWSQERFVDIKSKLGKYLLKTGFKESETTFVPCSGLTGENLISSSESPELEWYDGPTIIEVIDKFKPPERHVNNALRICVNDVFKGLTGGFCAAGKLESGYVSSGDKVVVMPIGEQGYVKVITMDDQIVHQAFAGENIILQLNGVDMNNVVTGNVICDIDRPIRACTLFEARLVIFNIAIPITRGFPVILHYQSACEQAVIRNIISQLHRSTGEVIKRKPRCLTKNTSAMVEIEVNKPICIELFKDLKNLGRFMLRYGGSTIAAGLVTSLK